MTNKKLLLILFLNVLTLLFCTTSYAQKSIGSEHVAYTQASISNLRVNQYSKSSIIKKLPINTMVTILEENGNWYAVRSTVDDETYQGWIHKDLLAEHPLSIKNALEQCRNLPESSPVRLQWLERASAIAPENLEVLGELVKTLKLQNEYDRAYKMAVAMPELMVYFIDKDIRGFEQYFPAISVEPLRAPFENIGTRLPKKDSDALANKLGIGYLGSAYYLAQGKIVIGEGVLGYVLLDQSYSERTEMFVVDAATGTVYDQQDIHEDSGDAGYSTKVESYFVDIDRDGYLDFISNQTLDGVDFEKKEKEGVEQYDCLEQKITYFMFSRQHRQYKKFNYSPYSRTSSHLAEIFKKIDNSCNLK